MPRIALSKAETGMIVTEDVKGPKGQPLLGSGVELNEKHLRILKTWGVQHITVEGEEAEDAASNIKLPNDCLEQAVELMKPVYRHTNSKNPIIQQLAKQSVYHEAYQLYSSGKQ